MLRDTGWALLATVMASDVVIAQQVAAPSPRKEQ